MSKIKVAIVILNWNGKKFLEQFFPSVLKFSTGSGIEVIVADNASTDRSLDYMNEEFPKVRIISLDKNYGFAGGYNRVLKEIGAEYYVLLNSDVEVTNNWILPVIDIMDKNPEIGACMPKLKSFFNKNLFEYAGAAGGFIDKHGYLFCRGRIFDTIETDHGQYDDTIEVFWATGACMFIRAEAFHQAGGFDEDFFAHMEEVDLCWRMKLAGYKIFYTSQSEVYHVGGGTLPHGNPFKTFLNYRNNLFMLYKNLPGKKLFNVIFSRLIMDVVSMIYSAFKGNTKDTFFIMKSHYHFLMAIPSLRRKRRLLYRFNNNKSMNMIYKGNIVFEYFVKKKRLYSKIMF